MRFSFFFFSSRRRHTRCSRDWSSDVCSSDLAAESLLQGVRADRHAYVLGSHHLIAAPFGHLEPQRHRAVGSDDQAEPGQPLETPAPTLGLFAVLSGDVARDVVLLVRDGALLLLERTLLRQPALGPLADK